MGFNKDNKKNNNHTNTNQHQHKNQEVNEKQEMINEQDLPTDNNENQDLDDAKKGKFKLEIKRLNSIIQNLEAENSKKQERINSLESQINLLNENFKSEVIKKGSEAQVKLDSKIKEFQEKYENELKHVRKYALKSSAIDLIDIISNFELAVNSNVSNPEINNYLKGFQMFAGMFKNYLSQNGIHEINVNVNDDFNAEVMQAFETQKKDDMPANKVLKIIKKGYKLHDIVLVPTTVIVSE